MTTAQDFARIAFRGMTYGKGDTPFFKHLEDVHDVAARYLPAYFVSHRERDAILAAAWLHDLIEDTDYTLEFVRGQFGDLVAEIVEGVTDKPGENRKARHRATYPLIACKPLPKFLKMCDRIANMTSCVNTGNAGVLAMYRKEYAYFRETLYVGGEFDALWAELDRLAAWGE